MEDGSIVKTKNLLSCIDREYMNTMIQHGHYMVPSDFQGVPFLKSEHTCKQVVAEGKIAEVSLWRGQDEEEEDAISTTIALID